MCEKPDRLRSHRRSFIFILSSISRSAGDGVETGSMPVCVFMYLSRKGVCLITVQLFFFSSHSVWVTVRTGRLTEVAHREITVLLFSFILGLSDYRSSESWRGLITQRNELLFYETTWDGCVIVGGRKQFQKWSWWKIRYRFQVWFDFESREIIQMLHFYIKWCISNSFIECFKCRKCYSISKIQKLESS